MSVTIGRLKLRGPPDRAAMARFAIEDGIRTAWPDDERLVLIRRVALGRTRPDQRADRRSAHFRQAWDMATQSRRHGGDSGAGDANCVWFESRGEAWRLLLRELIAGRRPTAWFWRLAVPDWQSESAREWLAVSLGEALAGRGPIEPVALVEAVVAEGGIDLLLAAAEQMATAPALRPIAGADRRADDDPVIDVDTVADAPLAAAEHATVALVLTIRENLPQRLVATIEQLVLRIGVAAPVARRLLERLLLRGSPALRLAPEQCADAVRVYAMLLDTGRVPAAVRPVSAPEAHPEAVTPIAKGAPGSPATEAEVVRPAAPESPTAEMQAAPEDPVVAPRSLSTLVGEAESPFAGLWLVVPILIRLGFREWLAEHPDLAAADGGRRLVRAIAGHFGVGSDDPASLPFVDCAPGDPDFARVWRIGLDFHLWRRARIRLHEVVRRRGWLRQVEERLVIRFDPDSVDLRLRRHAFDVDPGWTDWLGLSVRYRYAERGEP